MYIPKFKFFHLNNKQQGSICFSLNSPKGRMCAVNSDIIICGIHFVWQRAAATTCIKQTRYYKQHEAACISRTRCTILYRPRIIETQLIGWFTNNNIMFNDFYKESPSLFFVPVCRDFDVGFFFQDSSAYCSAFLLMN